MLPQEEGWDKLAFSFRLCFPHAKPFPPQPWGSRELSSLEEPARSQMSHWGTWHAFPQRPPRVSPGARELQQALGCADRKEPGAELPGGGMEGACCPANTCARRCEVHSSWAYRTFTSSEKEARGVTQSFSYSLVFCGLSSPLAMVTCG